MWASSRIYRISRNVVADKHTNDAISHKLTSISKSAFDQRPIIHSSLLFLGISVYESILMAARSSLEIGCYYFELNLNSNKDWLPIDRAVDCEQWWQLTDSCTSSVSCTDPAHVQIFEPAGCNCDWIGLWWVVGGNCHWEGTYRRFVSLMACSLCRLLVFWCNSVSCIIIKYN